MGVYKGVLASPYGWCLDLIEYIPLLSNPSPSPSWQSSWDKVSSTLYNPLWFENKMVAWENKLPTACEYKRIPAMIGVRIQPRISWQLPHSDLGMSLPTSHYFRLPKRRKLNIWVDDDCNLRSFAYIPKRVILKRDILKRVLCIFLGHATIYTTNNLLSSQNVTSGQFAKSKIKKILR